MHKQFVLFAFFMSVSACGRTNIIPDNARTQTYEPRIDVILKQLVRVLEPTEQRLGFQYVVWDADNVTEEFELACIDTSWRKLYINSAMLSLSDDAVAFIISHELGHVIEPGAPKPLLFMGWIGGSAGSGVLVGALSQWYWGLLAGSGVGLILVPPMLLTAMRNNESQSDEFALRTMTKAGFNPSKAVAEMCNLFYSVEPYQDKLARSGRGTHPSAENRCRNLKKNFESLVTP